MMEKNAKNKKVALIILLFFIASLLPIIAISFFSVPSYDDFNHSIEIYKVLQNNGSMIDVLKTAFEWTKHMYMTWQGTYSAIFISALQPGVFNENLYFIAPLFLVGTLILSNFYSVKSILKTLRVDSNSILIILGVIISFLQVQMLPSAQEGFFWWAGGIMHTFSFSLMLFQLAYLLRVLNKKKISILNILILVLISIVVGGGGHEIALASFTITALIILLYIVINKMNKFDINKVNYAYLGIVVISTGVCLILNAAAPGNALRSQEFGAQVPAILAVVESFVYSFIHFFEYTSLGTVFMTLLIFYYLFPSIKKIDIKLPNPLILFGLTWCAYASIFTPAIYGENYVASPRYLNVLYFAFFWFLIANLVFVLIYNKNSSKLNEFYNLFHKIFDIKAIFQVIIIIAILGSSVLQFSYADATSTSALLDILLGNAREFKRINEERFEILKDTSMTDVALPNYDKIVRVFFYDEFGCVPGVGKNDIYERYFNKNTVVATKEYCSIK